MDRMIELTDLTEQDPTPIVVPVSAVGRTVRGWYPANGFTRQDEIEMVDEFHEALNEQDYELARDLAAELGIGFDEVQTTPGY